MHVAFVIPVDLVSFPKIKSYFEFYSGRGEWLAHSSHFFRASEDLILS